jgi:hypothetical protein
VAGNFIAPTLSSIPTEYKNRVKDLIDDFTSGFNAGQFPASEEGQSSDINRDNYSISFRGDDSAFQDLLFNGDPDGSTSQFLITEKSSNVRLSGRYLLKNGDYRATFCADYNGRRWLTIPITMQLEYGKWNRPYEKGIVQTGFVMPKPKSNNGFCKLPQDVAIINQDPNYQIKCVAAVGRTGENSACTVNDTQTKINICIRGYGVSQSPAIGIGVGLARNNAGAVIAPGNDGGLDYSLAVPRGDDYFYDARCYKTSLEYYSKTSNKGCSDFVRFDVATNTLSELPGYGNCTRCLYGSENVITKSAVISDKIYTYGPGGPQEIAKDSFTGSVITPYNEPLATPISGRLYTDIGGCINASSTGSVVNTIVRVALGVMGGVVILRIIQGALTMQKGDPEGFQEGREVITSALIGLLLLIFSAAVLNFLGINILGMDVATFGS